MREPRNYRFPHNPIQPATLPVVNNTVLFNGDNASQILALIPKAKLFTFHILLPNNTILRSGDTVNIETLIIGENNE